MTYAELMAWSRMTGTMIRSDEVVILIEMFAARRAWWDERRRQEHKK